MWTAIVMTAVLQSAPPEPGKAGSPSQAQFGGATCRSVGLDPPRTWQFRRAGDAWEVVHWQGTGMKESTRVALPASASVQLTNAAVRVKARTSNGGIDVTLSGSPAEARLDIYVSYELEVNVDASLTPAIDELNTDGPIGVRCDVNGA